MRLFIKICGITSLDDALTAAELGADAIGLNFFPNSPRYLSLESATAICRALPPHILTVGLFVNAPPDVVHLYDQACHFSLIQFHGDETPDLCRPWFPRAIRAVRLRSEAEIPQLDQWRNVHMLLCDAAVPGTFGGTGQRADWSLARRLVETGFTVLLAGGLTPTNVADAVRIVRPFGVDVAGGVESAPGKKDPVKLANFIRAAREAAHAL
ncbi:MAG: phosphoribosylanthranilate isomerase [bacterium]|nr:phosphoribosylanthranilate isomerase [bacterium]